MQPLRNTHAALKAGSTTVLLLLVALLALPGCLLTDHTEHEAGVATTDMQIPASGYQPGGPSRSPAIVFDSVAMHMGHILEGVQVEKSYGFVNNGTVDLVITDVRASCGCTVAKNWPRMPIAPGARGAITVNFNSQGRPGKQHKTITVVANTTPPTTVLTLTGEVVALSTH